MRRAILIPLLAAVALGGLSITAIAEENKNSRPESELELIEKMNAMESLNDKLQDLNTLVTRIAQKKYYDCLKAFGSQIFCQCIRDKSPVGIDFAGYIKIVTTPKDVLGYSQASKEDKGIIDNTLKAREACARQ